MEEALFTALRGLVGDRVYPIAFPQEESPPMVWPAIRYTFISTVPTAATICGDGGEESTDIRVQLDLVDVGPDEVRALRSQVREVMQSFTPPAINQSSFELFDAETKTYRIVMEYVIFQ